MKIIIIIIPLAFVTLCMAKNMPFRRNKAPATPKRKNAKTQKLTDVLKTGAEKVKELDPNTLGHYVDAASFVIDTLHEGVTWLRRLHKMVMEKEIDSDKVRLVV